ncbi:MAG TPA: extracellular solute-binding protein, partial [Sphaerochaeta sp.]|nr:extracellular solute-binding protein [Sphaerochaeta sp.]
MKQVLKRLTVICLVALFATTLFAQGTKDEQKAGGTLNVYSIMPEKYATQIFEEFTKDTGIKVNFVRLSSGEALARLIAEKANPQVDALWGGPADTYEAGVLEGVFESYVPSEADKVPAQFKSPNGYWTGIGVIPLTFLTNTKFLEQNGLKAPTSWNDLLDPAYKNGLQMADVRTS